MGIWYYNDGHAFDPAFVVWLGEGGGGRLAARTELVEQGGTACIYDGALGEVALECRTS